LSDEPISQYRLGIVGYEMLVGCEEFAKLASTRLAILRPRISSLARSPRGTRPRFDFPEWPPLETIRPGDCPKFLSDAIDRMIKPDPRDRFGTLAEAVKTIARRNLDVEVARDSFIRILKDHDNEKQFFRAFYSRFLRYCPPAAEEFARKFGGTDTPARSVLDDLAAEDPRGGWPRQFQKLKQAIVLLIAFNLLEDSEDQGLTILTQIAETHRGYPATYYDKFGRAFIETVLDFDQEGKANDELPDAWENAIAPGIKYMKRMSADSEAIPPRGWARPREASQDEGLGGPARFPGPPGPRS
jgi:hypothetical protein